MTVKDEIIAAGELAFGAGAAHEQEKTGGVRVLTTAVYSVLVAIAALILMGLFNFILVVRWKRQDGVAQGKKEQALLDLTNRFEEYTKRMDERFEEYARTVNRLDRVLAAITGKTNGTSYRTEDRP
jgi:hypothetical protein